MVERYTVKEIRDKANDLFTMGNARLGRLVYTTLSKLPKEIANRVLKECIFLMPSYENGLYIPKSLLEGKDMMAFSERLLDKKGEEYFIDNVILHEIAHFHLGHEHPSIPLEEKNPSTKLVNLILKQEEEADKQVEIWLQSIKSK